MYNSFKVKEPLYFSNTWNMFFNNVLKNHNEKLRSLFQTLLLKETPDLKDWVPVLSGKKDIQELPRAFLWWLTRDLKTLKISTNPLFIFRNKVWSLNLKWPKTKTKNNGFKTLPLFSISYSINLLTLTNKNTARILQLQSTLFINSTASLSYSKPN